jgi:hypothetical protein
VAIALFDNTVNHSQPSPVPFPTSFVVKNGSKMQALASGVIPQPESILLSVT